MSTLSQKSGDRRRMLQLSLAAGLAALTAPGTAVAQEADAAAPASLLGPRPRPVVDARFPAEIAPGVFILPDNRIPLVPNIAIIVGRERVLVVDCGLGLESAEAVLDTTRRLAPGREIVLTVTHAHPEHGFGAQVFKPDARIFYNRIQRDYFAESGTRLLEGFRAGVVTADARDVLDGIVLTPPDEVYDGGSTTLDLGGRRVDLRTWGVTHTPGDQIVHLPDEGILITGDLVEERMFPIVPLLPPMITARDIGLSLWETALRDMVALQARVVVPGHGGLGGTEVVQGVLDYFTRVRGLVSARGASGTELTARIQALYPAWENPQFIGLLVEYLSQAYS